MAFPSHTMFFALSHLILLLCLIHESQSCPKSIHFECRDCAYFNGNTSLEFPFTNSSLPGCGDCVLTCEDDHTRINCKGLRHPRARHQVSYINPRNHTIVAQLLDPCEAHYTDSFPQTSYVSYTILENFETVMICPTKNRDPNLDPQICADEGDHIAYGPYKDGPPPKSLFPPPHECSLKNYSFSIQYNISSQCQRCVDEGGRCCADPIHWEFVCDYGVHIRKMSEQGKHILEVLLFSAFSGLAVIALVLLIYWKRRKIRSSSILPSTRKFIIENRNFETLLKSYASLTPKKYTYSDIKKMTNSFGEKLGEGGFHGVYKGKLLGGRLVAVKLLKNSKGDGEGFINEVASIGRTNHVNVVSLLGFCFEGHKRALVYEYMVNGSLEKFRHGKANNEQTIPLETLFHIFLGIARGLEYLHRGCTTRILHFDIKPHNILLDEEFCPKISDFGLAKLTPQDKQSKISMSGTRGTIRYIAPEVFLQKLWRCLAQIRCL